MIPFVMMFATMIFISSFLVLLGIRRMNVEKTKWPNFSTSIYKSRKAKEKRMENKQKRLDIKMALDLADSHQLTKEDIEDINIVDIAQTAKDGWNLLIYASGYDIELTEYLLELKVFDINHKSNNGFTALDVAGNTEIVRLLLDGGANIKEMSNNSIMVCGNNTQEEHDFCNNRIKARKYINIMKEYIDRINEKEGDDEFDYSDEFSIVYNDIVDAIKTYNKEKISKLITVGLELNKLEIQNQFVLFQICINIYMYKYNIEDNEGYYSDGEDDWKNYKELIGFLEYIIKEDKRLNKELLYYSFSTLETNAPMIKIDEKYMINFEEFKLAEFDIFVFKLLKDIDSELFNDFFNKILYGNEPIMEPHYYPGSELVSFSCTMFEPDEEMKTIANTILDALN